jgi:trehalose synthase
MADGAGGILVDSTEATAEALVELLGDRGRADALGRAGRDRVHEHFLLPRLLLNELVLLNAIVAGDDGRREQDPMCGLILDPERETPAIEEDGVRYSFCSDDCRRAFVTRHARRHAAVPAS